MSSLRFLTVTTSVLFSLALTAGASAQVQHTGSLVGKVVDTSGGVLPGVTVEASSPALIRPETYVTDEKGTYRFILLPIGVYKLTFSLPSFRTLVRADIPVSADKTLSIDIIMEVAAVAETVTVSGLAPVVDLTSATAAINLDRNAIDSLPTSRDVWSFLQNQAPQVVISREDVGGSESGLQATFSVHGSAWHQNTFSFNGINVTGVNGTGTTDLYFDYDTFQELQISTGAHKAEVSTPGVYINIVARSGSDSWRGLVQNHFTNSTLQSNNLTDELRSAGLTRGQGIDLINSFSVQAGGPLVKKRLTIYGNYRDDRANRFVLGFPLTEDTIIKAPLVNGTYQINERNRLNGLLTYNKYDKPNRNAGPLLQPETTWIEDNHATVWGVEWQSTLSNSTLLDVRVGHTGNVFQLFTQPTAQRPYIQELTTGEARGAAFIELQNKHERFQMSGYLSHYKGDWLGGSHDFKFGYDVSRGPNETLLSAFEHVNLFTFNGVSSRVFQYNSPALGRELHWFYPFYAQDTYTAGRTTVSLGLRFEAYRGNVRESSPGAGRFVRARSFPEKKGMSFEKFLPRIAVSRDVFGDSKLAFKGSYGRYAHTAGSPWFQGISEGGLGGETYRWNDRNRDLNFQEGEEGELLGATGGSITSVDPAVRQPYTDEVTLGIDSGVVRDMRLSALFVYRRKRDLLALINTGVPFSSYSQVLALDVGEDGISGTADDRTIEVFNQDQASLGKDRLLYTNPSAFKGTFRGLELTAEKRWSNRWQWLGSFAVGDNDISAQAVAGSFGTFGGDEEDTGLSGVLTGSGSPFLQPNGLINNTSGRTWYDRTYVFKTSGTYMMPAAILVSGLLKVQSGTPFARVASINTDINGVPFNQGSISIYAEPRSSREYPTLKMLDLRVMKAFSKGRHKLEAMVDVFNALNWSTITSINANTGTEFGSPLAIIGPRVVRIGARYSF